MNFKLLNQTTASFHRKNLSTLFIPKQIEFKYDNENEQHLKNELSENIIPQISQLKVVLTKVVYNFLTHFLTVT